MTLVTIIVTAIVVLVSLLIGYGLGITRNRE
jgi:ABC-type glycerol-3-phosphate transport system permease component